MSCWTKTEKNHGGTHYPHGDQCLLQTAGVGMLVEVMQIVIDPEAVQHSQVAEACYEIMGVESYRTVLHYCHGVADSGICGEEPVYLCTAEADFILCLYEPVPHFRAHDA